MPDSGIQAPYLDPSQYPAYLDVQRKQQLAQMLMQGTMQSTQTPADWNSMKVVPRRSPLANIATLVSGLMAGKAQTSAQKAQADYFQGLMGSGNAAPAAAAPPQEAPNEPPPLLRSPDYQPPQQAPAPSGIAQQRSGNPMLLPGTTPQQSQMLLQMMGPAEYGKAVAGQYAPTDLEKTLRAAGIPQNQWGPILQANVQKQNYIAPLEEREGSVERDPRSNAVIGVNPKTDTGGLNLFDAQGRYSGQAIAPGAAEAIRQSEQAAALGKTQGQYNVLPSAGGGSTVVPPGGTPTPGTQAPRVAAPSNGPSRLAVPQKPGWSGMPQLPISSALGAPDAFTEGRLKAAGSKDAELSSQYGKEADLADQKLQYNIEARKNIGNAELGPSSEWMTENRAKLAEWGVPDSLIPGSGKVTDTQELNKYLKQSALQGARQIFGSRMTQMEVKLQHEELSPSTAMTHDAILSLMNQDDIKQTYAKQRADDYGTYVRSGGDPLRFESWYAKNFPLTKFAKQEIQPAAPHPFTPEEIRAEMNRRKLGG